MLSRFPRIVGMRAVNCLLATRGSIGSTCVAVAAGEAGFLKPLHEIDRVRFWAWAGASFGGRVIAGVDGAGAGNRRGLSG